VQYERNLAGWFSGNDVTKKRVDMQELMKKLERECKAMKGEKSAGTPTVVEDDDDDVMIVSETKGAPKPMSRYGRPNTPKPSATPILPQKPVVRVGLPKPPPKFVSPLLAPLAKPAPAPKPPATPNIAEKPKIKLSPVHSILAPSPPKSPKKDQDKTMSPDSDDDEEAGPSLVDLEGLAKDAALRKGILS